MQINASINKREMQLRFRRNSEPGCEEVHGQKLDPRRPPKHEAERNAVLSVAPASAQGGVPESPRLSIILKDSPLPPQEEAPSP